MKEELKKIQNQLVLLLEKIDDKFAHADAVEEALNKLEVSMLKLIVKTIE
jgi:hypothetical protein